MKLLTGLADRAMHCVNKLQDPQFISPTS